MSDDSRDANEEVHLGLAADAGQTSTQTPTFRKSERQSETYRRDREAAVCAIEVNKSGRSPA